MRFVPMVPCGLHPDHPMVQQTAAGSHPALRSTAALTAAKKKRQSRTMRPQHGASDRRPKRGDASSRWRCA